MAVKIGCRHVTDFCLADWLFEVLPAGTYYLTLSTSWNGPKEGATQIMLIREREDGRLSGMTIEDPTSTGGLPGYAERYGFSATDESRTVFVRRK